MSSSGYIEVGMILSRDCRIRHIECTDPEIEKEIKKTGAIGGFGHTYVAIIQSNYRLKTISSCMRYGCRHLILGSKNGSVPEESI